ncbi:hypothetical protein RB195_007343 [Necator americanus]|uniref:Uncharacterized protein n=1 Tax=Necator americanus TaxID=51031 RepID=A0ABR1BWW4_NECAM
MSDVSNSFSAWETLPEDEPPLCIAVRRPVSPPRHNEAEERPSHPLLKQHSLFLPNAHKIEFEAGRIHWNYKFWMSLHLSSFIRKVLLNGYYPRCIEAPKLIRLRENSSSAYEHSIRMNLLSVAGEKKLCLIVYQQE